MATPFVKKQQALQARADAAIRGRLIWLSKEIYMDPNGNLMARGDGTYVRRVHGPIGRQ